MKIEYTDQEVSEIVEKHTLSILGNSMDGKEIVVSGYGAYSVRITDSTEPEPVDESV